MDDKLIVELYWERKEEAVSDGPDLLDGGVLFTIVCYEESMTEKQFIENDDRN